MTDGPSRTPSDAMVALDQIDELIRKAYPVPLTIQVRVDPHELRALLDRLRTALSHEPPEVAAMLGELDALVQRAKPIPLIGQVRIDREEIYDVMDRMRATIADAS